MAAGAKINVSYSLLIVSKSVVSLTMSHTEHVAFLPQCVSLFIVL